MSTIPSIQPTGNQVKRVVLETSLKPFMRMDDSSISSVCRELFRQWYPLLKVAGECSVMLWVADGSEILVWNNDLTQEMEWGRYIGFCNGEYDLYHGMGPDHPRAAKLYTDDPPIITFGDLRRIVATLKTVGREEFGLNVTVGETFDPGPEFAYSPFKYDTHKEIIGGGPGSQIGPSFAMVNAWSRLHADTVSYAGYPDGIPEGTTFGSFLGRQSNSFLNAMGFDYLWLSNGFGFSHFAWSYLGVNFDGEKFGGADFSSTEKAILTYWQDFRRACPNIPVEVRGTNFAMSMDLASDFTPYKSIYEGGFVRLPPPNSPWGPLNKDFGLEIIGFMSRIAVLPADDFLFRYYPNDPWFWQNPWWDHYDRQPFDIYCPMSVSRIRADGSVQNPEVIQFLTVDTEKGILDERCALEVIPHIRRGIDDYPNEPGVLTWLYPFDEYHQIAASIPEQVPAVFFGDWFCRSAVNAGLPLNTVLATRDFDGRVIDGTVLFTPTAMPTGSYETKLIDYVTSGGSVFLYGPAELAPEPIRRLLGISIGESVSGKVVLTGRVDYDHLDTPLPSASFFHDSVSSGGGLCEILGRGVGSETKVIAEARCAGLSRIYALVRSHRDWNEGRVGWIRGTNPFFTRREPGETSRVPRQFPDAGYDASALCRVVLGELGYRFVQHRTNANVRSVLTFVSRRDNGYHVTGYCPDTTASISMAFDEGAPLFCGTKAKLEDGMAWYHLEQSFHRECRIFVSGDFTGTVECIEIPPFPSEKSRKIQVTGARGSAIVVRPPISKLNSVLIEADGIDISQKGHTTGKHIVLPDAPGVVSFAW